MGKVIVMNWVTLEGVMQGAGRADEDARDGFEHGGWATPYGDQATVAWPNSTLLGGDVPAAVAELKESSGANLVIMGSGVLIVSLMAADVIDEYLLMIAPVGLGTGRRLFDGVKHAPLRLIESSTTSKGVLPCRRPDPKARPSSRRGGRDVALDRSS